MSSNVIKMYPQNAAKDPNAVLEQAMGEYKNVLVLGFKEDNRLEARADLGFTRANLLWCIETFKLMLLDMPPLDEED